jgi:hypothetical protein
MSDYDFNKIIKELQKFKEDLELKEKYIEELENDSKGVDILRKDELTFLNNS